jgi:carboxypeptidase Taq
VRELPEAWNDRYSQDLGLTPSSDSEGVLQDVRWYTARIGGMFQSYTLGNLMGAQFFRAAISAHPDIPQQIAQGQFHTLHHWLQDKIYRHGSKYSPAEILERVTGQPLSPAPLMQHIQQKYGELYDLP